MSEFLAINFDMLSSPSLTIKNINNFSVNNGWGFAWYPNDDYSSLMIKDSRQQDINELSTVVNDWDNFRSTIFMCKTKGISKQYTLHDVQPFRWSYAGKDWLFLHNGTCDIKVLTEKHDLQSGFLVPLGNTDSELLFCYLLGKIQQSGFTELNKKSARLISTCLKELEAFGTLDLILTDSKTLFVYHGENSEKEIYVSKLLSEYFTKKIESESISIEMEDPRDTYHSGLIVSSEKLSSVEQMMINKGDVILIKRGINIWQKSKAELTQNERSRLMSTTFEPQLTKVKETPSKNAVKIQNLRSITTKPDGSAMQFKSFDIEHSTSYEYDEAVEHSTHTFRLQPKEDSIQEIIRSEISISVDGECLQFEDVFGNNTVHYTISKPYKKLQIFSKSQVKVYEKLPDNRSDLVRRSSIPLVWMPWQRQMMSPYLLPTELPESQLSVLTDYAMSFVERCDYNVLETIKDINTRIYEDYQYVQNVTSLQTTPFDVLETHQGVCQDFANLFICLARLLSIPARYRMGYIYTGANYENKIQSDASHAWVEVYIPFIGWKGFDPTNGCIVKQDHIRVACGRNYRDATPTTGTLFKGGGTETLSIDVKVRQL